LPVVAGCYYGTLQGEFLSLPAGNIFTFLSPETLIDQPGQEARALQIAHSLANQYGTHMIPFLHNSYAGSTARVYPLQYPTSPAQEFHATNSGAASGTLSSVTRALLVKHEVRRRGRGSQGRSYLAPMPDIGLGTTARTFSSAFVADVTAAYNAFILGVLTDYSTAFTGESISYVQLSRLGAGATYPVIDSAGELAVASQRRRARRREIGG